ncbi:hypothetical protein L7F22_017631 [Adiantum nelumboides]|nr:hypothetical protein [Adiantum nelumboides]
MGATGHGEGSEKEMTGTGQEFAMQADVGQEITTRLGNTRGQGSKPLVTRPRENGISNNSDDFSDEEEHDQVDDDDDDDDDEQTEGTSGQDLGFDDNDQDDPPNGPRPSSGGATTEPTNPPDSQSQPPPQAPGGSRGNQAVDFGGTQDVARQELATQLGNVFTIGQGSKLWLLFPEASLYTTIQENKLLLKQVQLPTFKGEAPNIECDAKAWLNAMDDYFLAIGTTPENQAMLGMFCLTRDAKLWWKQHCRDNPDSIPSWERMKPAVKKRYLPLAHQAIKMNEFFALRQLALTLEEYYTKFVSLRRHAPQMTMEQQIARFCQGLNRPLNM